MAPVTMQFQVIAFDYTDAEALTRRMANREAHLKLGDEMKSQGQLLFAAAQLDPSGKMIGSTMIVEFPSRMELDAWLKHEPYVVGKVWEKIDITPCKVGPSFSKAQNDSKK